MLDEEDDALDYSDEEAQEQQPQPQQEAPHATKLLLQYRNCSAISCSFKPRTVGDSVGPMTRPLFCLGIRRGRRQVRLRAPPSRHGRTKTSSKLRVSIVQARDGSALNTGRDCIDEILLWGHLE